MLGLSKHLKTILEAQPFMTEGEGPDAKAIPYFKGKGFDDQEPPYVVLHESTTDENEYLDGELDFAEADIQIDVVHSDDDKAQALAESIKEYLRNYSGTRDNHVIEQCIIDGVMNGDWDTELGLYRWIVDLTVTHFQE